MTLYADDQDLLPEGKEQTQVLWHTNWKSLQINIKWKYLPWKLNRC